MSAIGVQPALVAPKPWLHRWIYYLAAGSLFAAAALRAFLIFQSTPYLEPALLLLGACLLLFIANVLLSPRREWLTALFLFMETGLVLYMLAASDEDFFGTLFTIIGMQAMQKFPPRLVGIVIGVFSLMTYFSLAEPMGSLQALALSLSYTALAAFMATYIWYTRRAEANQKQQQSLMNELNEANEKLEVQARQQEQLIAVHERQHLARELHDSVTQTLFSMTLTTQSALLLLEKDPAQVSGQLDRLDQLSQGAMAEMQTLISQLAPSAGGSDFVTRLEQHLQERQRVDGLVVELQVEGNQSLNAAEESGLLRIAQEALNNIVKHAGVSEASLHLHLTEPFWMEVRDDGAGFDRRNAPDGRKMGLTGMEERAAEIAWSLRVESSPGHGTRIHVEKDQRGEG